MFTVYILYSAKFNQIYIGYTSDLPNRFLSHNELATKGHTIKYRPWVIAHTEEFETKTEAIKRENYLKSTLGRKFARNIIKEKFGSSDGFFKAQDSYPPQSGRQFDPAPRYI